ncbi:MAG TPA: RAMP superfamily CRISPR-associated protein [Bryobacteraceae bacterium]|nr:RAMP superfamily CRISPR-associated protein [Bryobacteraceae bacterium]
MIGTSQSGLVVKFRPTGPWRVGPDSGARNGVDLVYHSDTLFSAVTGAMRLLGHMEDWLEATARNATRSAVTFSSLFPFHNEVGFIVPPRSVWPPPASTKVRWKGARFIPLGLVAPLLSGRTLEEDHWDVDGPSQCLVPAGRPGPFRMILRSGAAVDRVSGNTEPHMVASLEFVPGAGLWAVIAFGGEDQRQRWDGPVRAALRLLADSGFGGERSRGWGRAEAPEFIEGSLPEMILPAPSAEQPAPPELEAAVAGESAAAPAVTAAPPETASPYWLLSLFSPAETDSIDWNRGSYTMLTRSGRVESPIRSGDLKKTLNMVAEGSVLVSSNPVLGGAPDVAPDGFAHPVYRSGLALAIPIPSQAVA